MIYQQPAAAAAGTPRQRLRAFGCSPIPAAAAAAAGTPRQRLRANRCPTGGARRAGTPRRDGHISSPIPAAGGCCSRNSAPTNSAPGWPYQQPDSAPSAAAPYQQPPRLQPELRANDSAPTTPRQRTPRRDGHTSSPTPRLRLQPELRANDSAPSAAAPYQQPDSAPTTPRLRLQPDSAPTTPRQRLRANELRAFGCSPIPAAQLMIYQQPAAAAAGTPRQRTPRLRLQPHTSSPTPRLRLQPELRANDSAPIVAPPVGQGAPELRANDSAPTTPRQRLRANELRAFGCSRNSAPTNSAPGWPYQQPHTSSPISPIPAAEGAPENGGIS